MSFRFRLFRLGFAFAALSLMGLVFCASAQEKAPAPESKGSDAAAAKTPKRDGLLQLEEQLRQALKMLKPNAADDLSANPAPVKPRAITPAQTKRAKDLAERRKNWMMMNPDDLTAMPSLEELFNLPEIGPDGRVKQTPSELKRIFGELDPEAKAKNNRKLKAEDDASAKRKRTGRLGEESSTDDPEETSGGKSKEQEPKKPFGAESSPLAAPTPAHSSWLDIFGLGNNLPTPEQEKAHKAYMQQYDQILDTARVGSQGNSLLNAINASKPSPAVPAGYGSSFSSSASLGQLSGFNFQSSPTLNSSLSGVTAPDLSSKALNSWNPYYTPPSSQPARTPPPAPSFEPPRRKF